MTAQYAKKKKHQTPAIKTLPFVALWVMGYIIGWVVLVALYEADVLDNNTFFEYLLFGLISGVPMLLTQTWLMRNQLNLHITRWFPISLLSWVSAVALMFALQDNIYNLRYDFDLSEQTVLSIQVALMFMPAALIQTALLWKHVRNAWLWSLAGLISAALFALPIADSRSNEEIAAVGLAALFQGMLMAVTMLFLSKQRRSEKSK